MNSMHTTSTATPSLRIAAMAWAALMMVCGLAAAHEDITLVQDADGKLVTGISEVIGPTPNYEFPVRVYEGGFSAALRSNDPGFVAPESNDGLPAGLSMLPTGTDVSYGVRAFNLPGSGRTNLAYWDGLGEVSFAPVAAGHALSIWGVEPGIAVADGSPADVPGFVFAHTDGDGGIHEHLLFDLANSAGSVAEGIYMWSVDLSMPGLESSEQFFILHETADAPLTLDNAVDWTHAHLDTLAVPEPGAVAILLSAGLTGLLWYRRRHADRR